MKIIKPGRQQDGWTEQYKCTGEGNKGGGCGAVLEVNKADLFHTTRCSLDVEYFMTFKCCACGVLTDIDDRETPWYPRELPSHSEWHDNKDF